MRALSYAIVLGCSIGTDKAAQTRREATFFPLYEKRKREREREREKKKERKKEKMSASERGRKRELRVRVVRLISVGDKEARSGRSEAVQRAFK